MKLVMIGGNSLFALVATAFLLGACQQPAPATPDATSAYGQKMSGDMEADRERRCCHRASRTGNK